MKARLDRLKRIEKLQRRLHDLARWRLTVLVKERDDRVRVHGEMMDALGGGLMAYGGPSAVGNRRVRALEVEMAAARVVQDAHARATLEHGSRAKLADRAVESAEIVYRRELEKKDLADLIEASLQNRPTGSRKP